MPKFLAKYNAKSLVLFAAASICLVAGGALLLPRLLATTGTAKPPEAGRTVTEDTDSPSEVQVSSKVATDYKVPADQPRSISIPSISASGLVEMVGLTKDNAVAVPSSIYFAGWYTNSVAPGEPGLSIIDGHVSGRYNPGIFKSIKSLKTNDEISVEFGDKSIRKFQVVSVTIVPETKAAQILFKKQNSIPKQLNLITCGGKFDKKTQSYADRVIVVAKLVK